MTSNVVDQPAKANEDRLNMKAYSDALTEFIRNAQSPLTIALQGEWGSGKTSLMNALKASLVDKEGAPYLGVWINTWQYALMSDPEEAIKSILLGIIGQISAAAKTSSDERVSLFKKIARIGGGVASDVFKKYSGVDAERVIKELSSGDAPLDKSGVEDLKKELDGLVKKALDNNKGKCGCLFFIDDLDRIDPPVAVQILELLKNIFDIDKCIFVLAIDYGVVVKGLKPKFGEMNAANEREFRSFFDKIIQLPFSMPVANYKIDDFLMESLSEIGYIDANEKKDKSLCESISYYALQSVGTNPRSLKRLINYLSLIKLIIAQTPTQDDDADFKEWKDVLFALVSLQIQYPKVYEALQGDGDSDFTSWGEEFEQKWRIPPLKDGEKEKLRKMVEFDEPWEQMLFRFCRLDTFLESRSINISRALNRIKARILDANQPVGDTVAWLLRLSAVTSVKSETETAAVPENFNKSNYLKDLRRHALGMRPGEGVPWCAVLGDDAVVTSYQARVQSNLQCQFRKGTLNGIAPNKKDYIHENYLAEFSFHIFHDGRSFQLKVWGEFWGRNNNPAKRFHIKFDGPNIQTDLESAENAVRDAWSAFDVKANCGHNPDDIWWNVTVPFKDYAEMVKGEFPKKLRESLVKVAAAFASLTPYRVPSNNNK